MKLFKKLIFIFLSIGALISCDGMDATYKEFIEEGPIVYIGKVDSLKAYAGRNRQYALSPKSPWRVLPATQIEYPTICLP